jgi:hypothetical protein
VTEEINPGIVLKFWRVFPRSFLEQWNFLYRGKLILMLKFRNPTNIALLSSFGFLLVLLLMVSACSEKAPEGTRIDFSSAREFKPFKLRDLEANERELKELLSKATLISFFFPT